MAGGGPLTRKKNLFALELSKTSSLVRGRRVLGKTSLPWKSRDYAIVGFRIAKGSFRHAPEGVTVIGD